MLPRDTLAGKVAVITGGGTGLGLRIAKTYAGLGAKLVLASRSTAHLDPAVAELRAAGADAVAVPTDVTDPHQTRAMVAAARERFGRIDILVNNAAGNFIRPAEALPEAAFRKVVDIVLNGTFYCSRAAGKVMIEQGGGVILNVVATYAWTGGPGTVHSAAAKAGVLAMTRTLAVEWARHNVRVVAIAPGPLDTEGASARLWPSEELRERVRRSIPLQRFARLQEVADAAAYLVSDHAGYITGEVLTLDGGGWLGRGVVGMSPDEAIPIVKRRRRPEPERKEPERKEEEEP
jgi:NAD(P)-dependent dehydrogenase (short-subunit alcohol dehydrogenase family)